MIFKFIVCSVVSLPGAILWGWAFDNEKVGVAVFCTSLVTLLLNDKK